MGLPRAFCISTKKTGEEGERFKQSNGFSAITAGQGHFSNGSTAPIGR